MLLTLGENGLNTLVESHPRIVLQALDLWERAAIVEIDSWFAFLSRIVDLERNDLGPVRF